MYYKITNKESDIYKKLHELRTKELEINESNRKAVYEKVGTDWDSFFGEDRQQSLLRCRVYAGFHFKDISKVCLKTWKEHKQHKGVYVPNMVTKLGKEMNKFLCSLPRSWFESVWNILGVPDNGRFKFPYLEICGDLIIVFLDEKQKPSDPNLIEIEEIEFNEILGIKEE